MYRQQRGFTLIELVAAIAISAIVLAGLAGETNRYLDNVQGQAAATYQKTVADAAQRYVKDNFAALQATATPTAPARVTIGDLVSGRYLASSFQAQNPFGQTPCVLVLEPVANKLEGVVVTEGGTAIPEGNAAFIAASTGASGGYIPDATPTTAKGSYGGWSLNIANYLTQNCSGTAATSGRLASALFVDGAAQFSNEFLYRVNVPGHPELNQMTTALNMGGNSINSANQVNATGRISTGEFVQIGGVATANTACSPNGLMGRDAVGLLLSCQSGVWKAPAGSSSAKFFASQGGASCATGFGTVQSGATVATQTGFCGEPLAFGLCVDGVFTNPFFSGLPPDNSCFGG